jgi:hypothetical protein
MEMGEPKEPSPWFVLSWVLSLAGKAVKDTEYVIKTYGTKQGAY